MRARCILLLCLASAACATGSRLDDPPLAVTMSVTGLKPDERALLRDQVCAMPNVRDCALDEKKREARLAFTYRGSLGNLRWRIAQLPHPGLKAQTASAALSYEGFDNLAPTIVVEQPPAGETIAQDGVDVVVTVKDPDTASVTIAGAAAAKEEGGRYRMRARLVEGQNVVVIVATDDAGNERKASFAVNVDTTPPALAVEVVVPAKDTAIVKGKAQGASRVTVDGKDVKLDLFGAFEVTLQSDPDKRSVVVKAFDALGNARSIKRGLTKPSPLSDASE